MKNILKSARLRTNVLLTFCALVLLGSALALAQDLRISDAKLGADQRFRITFPADTTFYYILYRGDVVTNIFLPTDAALAPATKLGELTEAVPPSSNESAFFRIRQVPMQQPLDTDGDGIDDVYELNGRPQLNPLNAADALSDPDNDGRTTLEEYRLGRNPFALDIPSVPRITYPTNATTASFVMFAGEGPINTLIRVEGGPAYVTNTVDTSGKFDLTVPLFPNRLNRLFVSAVDEFGESSPTAPIDILQDSTPSYAFIDFPTNGMTLTTETTLVAGRVGDSLSGFLGLNVAVNGQSAQVDVGIGPNGTYQRGGVPLAIGANEIEVTATDRLGNLARKSITVIRIVPAGPRLLAVSGDVQGTNILRRLTQPIVVRLANADGTPLAKKPVDFRVTRSDGRLLPVDINLVAAGVSPLQSSPSWTSNGVLSLQWVTDANGEARVWWTMRTDAGHANNRVTVSATDIQETANFCASASALPAKQMNIGSGNNRRGETLGPAPEPLKVWVSDGNNPVAGIPVTFRVVQGGGTLVPIVTADGTSPAGLGLCASRPTTSIALRIAPLSRPGAPLSPSDGERGGNAPAATMNDSSKSAETGRTIPPLLGERAGVRARVITHSSSPSNASEVTVLTGITGHAEVDYTFGPDAGHQIIEATFPGNMGLPATFVLSALARTPGQPTSFTGLILDNTSQPIGGAFCEMSVNGGTNVTVSDSQGRFAFANIAAGAGHLKVNGATATTLGTNSIQTNSFPFLQYTIAVVPNAENSLPTPVLLPRLNPANAKWYYGTNDLLVTCEGIEGLKMTIKANSMHHPGGQLVDLSHPTLVSLNQVHHDNIPMPMPDGASPPFAWTLQPGGATFDPPVQVEYPNMSGLAPGAAAYFLTFNHDTERFEIVASGHVVEDGSTILNDPGSGLTISGWGCNCPPYSVTGQCERTALVTQTVATRPGNRNRRKLGVGEEVVCTISPASIEEVTWTLIGPGELSCINCASTRFVAPASAARSTIRAQFSYNGTLHNSTVDFDRGGG